MKMNVIIITINELENATLEAIYWWNRTEGYYHEYFSKIDKLHNNDNLFQFFTTKLFETFLKEYSIRRNIAFGFKNVDNFLESILKQEFFSRVNNGEIQVIDDVSEEIRVNTEITNNRQSRSLLSKIAFLINPTKFSLFDNLAKNSLWDLVKNSKCCKYSDLESYTIFMFHIEQQIKLNSDILNHRDIYLANFKETEAYSFFCSNKVAFERRVFDKYLWLRKINIKEGGRIINNNAYKEFMQLASKSADKTN